MKKENNSLVKQAEAIKFSSISEASIKEANLTYFIIIIATILSILLLIPLNGRISVGVCIVIAVLSLLLSLSLSIVGIKHKQDKKFRPAFYLSFMLNTLSILFSVLAVLKYYDKNLIKEDYYFLAVFLALAVMDLVILSTGKRERLLFSLSSIAYLAVLIISLVLSLDVIAAYCTILLFLHLSMLAYVFSGENFFALMSVFYLIIALIALIVALIVISGSGDCDCSGGDCGLSDLGGRRKKQQP